MPLNIRQLLIPAILTNNKQTIFSFSAKSTIFVQHIFNKV